MTSKRISSTNRQIIQLQEGVLKTMYFTLNGEHSIVALVPHQAVVYVCEDRKYEHLYSIPSGDALFTSCDVRYLEEHPQLCIGTSYGQILLYDLTVSQANFSGSQLVAKARVAPLLCTEGGIYAQTGNSLYCCLDGESQVFRSGTQAVQIEYDPYAFILYANTRYKKFNTVIAYDVAGVDFFVVDEQNFHSRSITAFCLDAQTGTLVTGDESGMCVVWSVRDLKSSGAKMIYCFKEGNYQIASLEFSPKYLLIFLLDVQGNSVVYDANRKIVIRRWGCNYQGTSGAILHEEYGEYCTYDYNSFIKFWEVWDAENGEK